MVWYHHFGFSVAQVAQVAELFELQTQLMNLFILNHLAR